MKNRMAFMLAAYLMVACSTETYEFKYDEEQRIQASFTSHIAPTRVVGNQWESGDEVGIFMQYHGQPLGDASLVDNAFNRKYIASAEGMLSPSAELDRLYYPAAGNVDIVAYYPFSNVHEYKVRIDVSNQRDLSAIDFVYSNNLTDIAPSVETQNLIFDHQLSKIIFNLSLSEELAGLSLEDAMLTFKNTVSEATFNLATGVLVSSTSLRDISVNISSAKAEAILIPQPCDDVEVTISLASGQYFMYDFSEEHEWESGVQYTYNLELDNKDKEATLEAEISAWSESDASSSLQETVVKPWDGTTVRTAWYVAGKTEMDIVYPEDLAGLAQLVNSGISFEGKTLRLANDLDMNAEPWTPIGGLDKPFKGTFEGNNHRVSNLAPQSETSRYIGLFGLSEGVIRNLVVEGTYDVATVDVEGAKEYLFNVGGLCGLNGGTISHCRNYASVKASISQTTDIQTNPYVGGISGQNNGTIDNCQNYGVVEAHNPNTGAKAYVHIGGIAGGNEGEILNCDNTRNLIAKGGNVRAGGIVGLSTGTDALIKDCTNLGDLSVPVSHNEASVGGIVGRLAKGSSVSEVVNKGYLDVALTAGEIVAGGGIVGQNDGAYLEAGINYGNIAVKGCGTDDMAMAGGIVGYNLNAATIHQSLHQAVASATGAVDNYAGGIVGYNKPETEESETVVPAGVVYDCCQSLGTPTLWTGNASETVTCDASHE